MYVTQEDKTMALLSHVLSLFFGFIPALIIWLIKKDQSAYVTMHAKESLNFQISMMIYYFAAGILMILLIGFILFPILYVLSLILVIMATIKAANGEEYRYPLCIRLIK